MLALTFLSLSFAACSYCQNNTEKDKHYSKAESFSHKSGTAIQRQYSEIGKISKCRFRVVHLTDLMSGEKLSALAIEYEHLFAGSSTTNTALLDVDEVDNYLKTVELILSQILHNKPKDYSEVIFRSRDGFESGCFLKTASDWRDWVGFFKVDEFDSESFLSFEQRDFEKLKDILQNARSLL